MVEEHCLHTLEIVLTVNGEARWLQIPLKEIDKIEQLRTEILTRLPLHGTVTDLEMRIKCNNHGLVRKLAAIPKEATGIDLSTKRQQAADSLVGAACTLIAPPKPLAVLQIRLPKRLIRILKNILN